MGANPDVEFAVLGGPADGPTLRLDHERFAYAGKFAMSTTGKAVARDPSGLVAAASFDRDRTDESVVRIRYVTVRRDRRGGGIGARLLAFLVEWALEEGASGDAGGIGGAREVRIAVNNPYAYEAAYKAGFSYTGERTGLAELLCATPGDRSTALYREGLSEFRERGDLDEAALAFVEERQDAEPPTVVTSPGD